MKATDLLKQQHAEVKDLFAEIEAADGAEAKGYFEDVAKKIVGHDVIERELFYPACERALGKSEMLGEAIVEHGVVEFSLYQADQARSDEDFDHRCIVLKEMILHHVKEEENELFPKVEKAMDRAELEELGARMEQRFDEIAEGEDFRALLKASLLKLLPAGLAGSRVERSAAGGRREHGANARNAKKAPRKTATRNAPKVASRSMPRTGRRKPPTKAPSKSRKAARRRA